jgi:predicted ATP-binding protein involved in virulence
MRIERLELTNFRGIRHLELEFPTQTTVLVGINGVGKSAILDALAMLLGKVVERLLRPQDQHHVPRLRQSDILIGATESKLKLRAGDEGESFVWLITESDLHPHRRSSPGVIPLDQKTDSALVDRLFKRRTRGRSLGSVPTIVQYSTSRGQWSSTQHSDVTTPAHPSVALKTALPAGIGTFDEFYAWFREREDIENEERAQGKVDFKDPQLEAVRAAVAALLEGFSNLRIERKLRRMTVQKNDEVLDVTQLSAGEKALLTLVSDLARRLSIANPESVDPRYEEGIVLIDEVDLHLHPRWQRRLLPSLERTFPKCQFIVTTHSPQVISEVKPERIYLLERKDGETVAKRPEASFGLDSNRILEDLMGVDERPRRIKEQLTQFFRLIDEGKLDEAKALRRELEAEIGSDEPNFAKGEVLIRRKEMLAGASHRPQR